VRKNLCFSFAGWRTEVSFEESLELATIGASASAGSLFVFDSATHGFFGADTRNALVFPMGEESKRWESVDSILHRLVDLGMGRDAEVIGVGGGVVCDIAAFAASLYMRGCALSLVPTTLLAMVDASVGGKTGVDFAGYKNLVGTFYPASRIHIVVGVLKSLPQREYLCGLAEAIKTAMIGDAGLLKLLGEERAHILARDESLIGEIVHRCLSVKGAIVAEDTREEGRRAVLNLGHTFGHALESCLGFRGWTHGEAVAWGIARSLDAGLGLGATDEGYAREVTDLLHAYGYRLETEVNGADLLAAMVMDKKRRGGRIRLALPKKPAEVIVREVDESLVSRVLGAGKERFGR
jgi:3-dehydroquinate synthase